MKSIKNKIGWAAIIILTIIPVISWYTMYPFHFRYTGAISTLTSLGQLFSLTGMPMFSLAMILSGRFRFFEDFFGGMNKVYVAHHLVGGLAFIFLMIHPIFLIFSRAQISYRSAALLIVPGGDWSINFAIIGLLTLMILLILTYFVKLRYNLWRFTHQFMGVAFFFGVLHVILVDSDISVNPFLRWYLLTLAGVGFVVYIYRTLLGSRLIKRYTFTVTAVEKASADVVNIRMKPDGNAVFPQMPGQFIFVSFHAEGFSKEVHPFSLSSSPDQQEFTITVKSSGDYTGTLVNLPVGAKAKIEGPYGRFFEGEHQNQLWIAGGIGVTPFLSKARSLKTLHQRIDFYYVVRGAKEAVYVDELLAIAQREPNLRVCLYDTSVEKRLTAETVQNISGDLKNMDIFICGPVPMMQSLREQFKKLGVANNRIHTEEFQLL